MPIRHRVISACYVSKILRSVGDYVWPTTEDSERLIWAGCLVKDPERAPVPAIIEAGPVSLEPEAEPEAEPEQATRRRRQKRKA